MAEKMARRFRERLEGKELLIIPGGFSPLHARMAQMVGFEAFFMAGSQTAAFVHGLPDMGIITLNDMVDNSRRLASSCSIPIFADADTGYGNAVNVYYTVQQFIRAGVAAIHIEDQEAPKKSGTSAGRSCISKVEAIGKYKAAVAARDALDPDFVIIARCDLIGTVGGTFEETIERCIAYVQEAKVDAIWVNTLRTRDEIKEACRRIPAPVLAPYYGPPPSPTHEEYQTMGGSRHPLPRPHDFHWTPGHVGFPERVSGTRTGRVTRVGRTRESKSLGVQSLDTARRSLKWTRSKSWKNSI